MKQFFVQMIGGTISLDILSVLGSRLTLDELQDVHDEVQRRNPTREMAWRAHVVRGPT